MKRKIKRAVVSLATSAIIGLLPSVAAHPGYIAEVSPWIASHPVQAAKTIAKGELWCQYCGEPYPVQMLGWFRSNGCSYLVCDGCYDEATAGL